jgi:hypothetical protein
LALAFVAVAAQRAGELEPWTAGIAKTATRGAASSDRRPLAPVPPFSRFSGVALASFFENPNK